MNRALPSAPYIPGYLWRPLRAEDAEALRRLELACAPVDHNHHPRTIEELRACIGAAGEDLPASTLCLVDARGGMAAYAWIEWDERIGESRAFLEGKVHPAYRGRGVGRFLVGWMEEVARSRFAGAAGRRVLRIDGYGHSSDALQLYDLCGFAFNHAEEEMRRPLDSPLPAPLLSPEMCFQEWSPERSPIFHGVYYRAFYQRPGFPGWSERQWREALTTSPGFRPDLSLLLTDGRTPVGFSMGAVDGSGRRGHIMQMGVDPAWRGRGLGASLIAETAARLRAEGALEIGLDVNINNPGALSLYRRLGFEYVRRYVSYQKELGESVGCGGARE
jgi:mycothiol synthase